ncbi:MAG TPA: ATP-binding cassette domain-containing protein [Phycisphaerae bacterium]|nr:ATP-binding cassette domain-containing protein [Phycisphaerae bacterium]
MEMLVRRGEVFGLLGPNGAGKSTLVKIIMSVTRPTQANGLVLDHPVGSKASLAKVGYLPEHHRFPRYLTGRQTLEFFAALSNIDKPTRQKRTAELLETVGMTAWADAKVSTYSKGMMQRVGVAQALVNDPDLVILDEPTDGVDPVGRREIRDVLLALKARGKTVFVNSHLLSELEMMADRVAILVAGRVVQQGTIDDLTRDSQCFSIEIEAPPGGTAATPPAELLRAALESRAKAVWKATAPPLAQVAPQAVSIDSAHAMSNGLLPDGTWLQVQGPLLRIGTTQAAAIQPVIDALRAAGLAIRRIQPVRQSLEDLFIQAVGGIEGGHNAGASIGRREGYRP